MIPGIAFRALQRDAAVDHQHLAGDVAGMIPGRMQLTRMLSRP
jgi:hypothetical protein